MKYVAHLLLSPLVVLAPLVFPDAGHELPSRQAVSASIDWLQKTVLPSQTQTRLR